MALFLWYSQGVYIKYKFMINIKSFILLLELGKLFLQYTLSRNIFIDKMQDFIEIKSHVSIYLFT